MSILERLKSKPERVKSNIALVGAILFTAGVGAVWTSTLPVRFATLGESLQVGIENTATAKNALTDLVTETQETTTPENVPMITEDSLQPSIIKESALEKLAEERFDPATATATPPSSEEDPIRMIPALEATSTSPSFGSATSTPSKAPVSGPRPILIGTTTKPTP